MGQTNSLPPSSVVPVTSGLCRLSSAPAGSWPFPALSPHSLYRCLDPYPAASLWCPRSFLPKELRPHLTVHRFGTLNDLRYATSTKEGFRGCSHSFMFKLPYSLDPQVAPTAVARSPLGSRAVYTTLWRCGYPSSTVVSLRIRHEQLIRRVFHPLDCGLAGRYRTAAFRHAAKRRLSLPNFRVSLS